MYDKAVSDRSVVVVDQFNFVGGTADNVELPDSITIELFPGTSNYSTVYVVSRKLMLESGTIGIEYSNRFFSKLTALGMVDSRSLSNVAACKHHGIAILNDKMYALDLW